MQLTSAYCPNTSILGMGKYSDKCWKYTSPAVAPIGVRMRSPIEGVRPFSMAYVGPVGKPLLRLVEEDVDRWTGIFRMSRRTKIEVKLRHKKYSIMYNKALSRSLGLGMHGNMQ